MEYESPMEQALVCPLLEANNNDDDKHKTTTSGFWSFWKTCQKDTNQSESLAKHSNIPPPPSPTTTATNHDDDDNNKTVVPVMEIQFVCSDNENNDTTIQDWLELELLEEGSLWSADLDTAVWQEQCTPHSTSDPIPKDLAPMVQDSQDAVHDNATAMTGHLQAWHAATVARRRRRQRHLLGALIGMAAFMATATGMAIWSAQLLGANHAQGGAQEESTAHP